MSYHERVEGLFAPGCKIGPTERALHILAEGIDELLGRRAPKEIVPTPETTSVWEDYQRIFDRPRARLTTGRRRLIHSRLKEFPRERLVRAFEGCFNSDWHMKRGAFKHREGPAYCDLELILRNAATVERFEAMKQGTDPVLEAFRFAESVPHMQVHQAVASALSRVSDPGGNIKEQAYQLLKVTNLNVREAIRLREAEIG